MSDLKRFKLEDSWKDWALTLEVDLDVLTSDKAAEINEFWSGHKDRLDDALGDVVRAVVKLAAERLVFAMLEYGGCQISDGGQSAIWTKENLHDQEGWGGSVEGGLFGWCGIRLVSAEVEVDLDLEFKGE